jgi:hypothetical protein
MSEIIPQDAARAAALGDRLTRLLDQQRDLHDQMLALNKEIYEELVNRLQSQIGAVLGPVDRRLAALEQTPP